LKPINLKSITFLIASLSGSGGTQRMLSILANHLVKSYDVSIFVNVSGAPYYDLDEKVKIVKLPKGLLKKNLFIYNYFKKHNTAFYINLDSNSVLFNGFLLPQKTKLIIWEHFSLRSNYNQLIFKLSRFYATLRSHKLVLLSKKEVSDWRLKFNLSDSKIELIQNPVSIQQPRNPKNNYDLKKVIAIGNDPEVKGFDTLVKAWRTLKTDWELDLVGLGKKQNQLFKSQLNINPTDRINLLGKVKNMEEIYANSSIFVLSSRKEAVPLVLIESQCFGLPAVVFNHLTSAVDIVEDSAVIADYNEPIKSLVNNLKSLIEDKDLYYSLHEKALINRENFSQSLFFQEWEKLVGND